MKKRNLEDEKVTLKQYLKREYGMVIMFIISFSVFCVLFTLNVKQKIHESEYNITTAKCIKYEYQTTTEDSDHRDVDQYTVIYKYTVNGSEYLYRDESGTSTENLPKYGHEILLRYVDSDPVKSHRQVNTTRDYILIASIVFMQFAVSIGVSNYYEINQGYDYSQIIMGFWFTFFMLILGVFGFYIVVFQNGYYSFSEGFHKKTVAFIVSSLLLLIGLFESSRNFRIIVNHIRKKAERKKE